jgi:hypothetical protein
MTSRPNYRLILLFDAAIGFAWWMTFHVIPEPWSWALLLGLHLAHPFYASRWAGRTRAWRGFLAGPGLVIGVYFALLVNYVIALWNGIPEDTWTAMMLAMALAIAIGLLAIYALVITAYLHRRALRR